MNVELIRQRRRDVIAHFGPWTVHNIHLADDIYTMEKLYKSWTWDA